MVNCSWMAYLPGAYKIIIRYGGDEIAGSPFACQITESEAGLQILEKQLAKINCTGPGLQCGLVNEPNEVRVNEVNGNCQLGIFVAQKNCSRRSNGAQLCHRFAASLGGSDRWLRCASSIRAVDSEIGFNTLVFFSVCQA